MGDLTSWRYDCGAYRPTLCHSPIQTDTFIVFFSENNRLNGIQPLKELSVVCMDGGQPDSTTATEKLLRGSESWDRWKYDWGLSDKSCKLEVLTCGNMFPMAMQFWISPRCSGPLWKKSIQQLSLNWSQ